MKTCPVCRSRCFDDMPVCYGCMYDFERNIPDEDMPDMSDMPEEAVRPQNQSQPHTQPEQSQLQPQPQSQSQQPPPQSQSQVQQPQPQPQPQVPYVSQPSSHTQAKTQPDSHPNVASSSVYPYEVSQSTHSYDASMSAHPCDASTSAQPHNLSSALHVFGASQISDTSAVHGQTYGQREESCSEERASTETSYNGADSCVLRVGDSKEDQTSCKASRKGTSPWLTLELSEGWRLVFRFEHI